MFGELLGASDYELLSNAADLAEFFAALRTTPYASTLRSESKNFAFAVRGHWVARVEKVAKLMPSAARELCLAYLAKVELEALKTLLRGILRGVNRRQLLSMLPPLPTGSRIPLTEFLATNNLEEAARALKRTPYAAAVAEEIKTVSTGGELADRSLLAFETALDRLFFAGLAATCQFFVGSEHTTIKRVIGTLADTTNVLAVERLRKTFGLTPQAAANYLVSFGFRMGGAQRRELCEWNGEGPAPFLLRESRPGVALATLARQLLCREAIKSLFTVPFHAGLALAYVLLSEIESSNLVTIYEAKQWGMDHAAILRRLIFFRSAAAAGDSGA
jgi:vacuolar-type H+-ATPase subunit C/Vma6